MAAGLATDTTYLHILEQAKLDLWSRNPHLSELQRQDLWSQTLASNASNAYTPAQPALTQHIPRSMAYGPSIIPNLGPMDRTHSAPAMGRSISTPSVPDNNMLLQRSFSMTSNWQPEEQSHGYALYSESAAIRRQSALQSIDETETLAPSAMVEYTPAEYIDNCTELRSPSLPLSHSQPSQLHVQLTTSSQWSPSMDGSISPSTPALMTPVTQASSDMSRQSSFNPQFFDQVSMLRVHSDSSVMFPLLPEDGSISFSSYNVDSKHISSSVDNSNFLTFTGNSEAFLSPAHVSASASALVSSQHKNEPCLAEDMRRSASSSSESDASSVSAPSTSSRQLRRDREINALAASRKIAPKAIDSSDEARSASNNAQMMRIQSEDGSSKNVGVITKTPYIRPQHPKIMCQYCNERTEGFRGTHELDRHIARAHAVVRKGYICVDASPNKKFLANCKHCRNRKVYGAYYNAAAHLRRAHFHPRKRGRKGKHDEKRGGIGGGDDPPMEILKQFWIKEIEVDNKPAAQSPDSASEAAEPSNNTYDSNYDMDASYQQPQGHSQPPAEMSNPVDPSQFVDLGMYVNTGEAMYDQTMQFASFDPNAATDISNFQFDAYMPQQ